MPANHWKGLECKPLLAKRYLDAELCLHPRFWIGKRRQPSDMGDLHAVLERASEADRTNLDFELSSERVAPKTTGVAVSVCGHPDYGMDGPVLISVSVGIHGCKIPDGRINPSGIWLKGLDDCNLTLRHPRIRFTPTALKLRWLSNSGKPIVSRSPGMRPFKRIN